MFHQLLRAGLVEVADGTVRLTPRGRPAEAARHEVLVSDGDRADAVRLLADAVAR